MIYNPSDLLPQKPPMAFISAIESADFNAQTMVARVDIKDTDLMFQKNLNGVPSAVALEYMAQAIACYIGAEEVNRVGKTSAAAGFILGSRDLHVEIPVFLVEKSYYVYIKSLFCDSNMASFECSIKDENEEIVATGNLNAFRPDNIKDFMENINE